VVHGSPGGFVAFSTLDSSSYPVQCAQQQQASVDNEVMVPGPPSPSQVDLTQDKLNSSQSFNPASQFSEDMFSDDSIERAAALIEEDQSANKDDSLFLVILQIKLKPLLLFLPKYLQLLDWGSTTKTILNQPIIVCFTPLYNTVTVGSFTWLYLTDFIVLFPLAEGADETTWQM
jgi:hypothetical protein